jgi:uncharacterized protein YjiK
VRITPHPQLRFDGPAAERDNRISNIVLNALNNIKLQGIAFNPNDGHIYITSPTEQKLYELTDQGELVSTRDLSPFQLSNIQNMVCAPSGDQTDNPEIMSLYIVDSGSSRSIQRPGDITELSLTPPAVLDLSLLSEPAILVQTINTFEWDPPSPDPAGGTYIPSSNSLLICDSEVEEISALYANANVFYSTLLGNLNSTFNTLDFSEEPTGVAYNPNNQHLFFSDDIQKKIFEIDAGTDGDYGTTDDIITWFSTIDFGSNDPEGVTYDTFHEHLFISDGVNAEVYEIGPGTNGIFDGVSAGDDVLINHFDTAILGLQDPEGIEFNTDNGNLYIVSRRTVDDIVVETIRSGTEVNVIDISALNAVHPSGLAYAPTSNNAQEKSLYIICRGVDNDPDPNENDGKIFEISLGSPVPSLTIDDVEVLEGNAGTVNATFTVTMSSSSLQEVTVDYSTQDGTAIDPSDYLSTSGSLSFDIGETTKPVIVQVNGDVTEESDQTFFVNLSNVSSNATLGDDQGKGTILDDDGSDPVTVSFQDGVNSYRGTQDTKLQEDTPTTNYGNEPELEVDGFDPFISTLLFWDVTSIPIASSIQSVDITVNVTNTSGADYEIYELKRIWIENEATWNIYASGQSWDVSGADGTGDRGSTAFGAIVGSSLGLTTIPLNAAGVAVVQSWINDPSSNHGFIVQDYINHSNKLGFSSRETSTIPERPKLTVTYLPNTAGITVTPTSGLSTTEDGGTATFDISANTEPSANVTVPLSSNDTGEGTVPSSVILPAGSTTPVTVTITGVDDQETDGDIAYNIVTGDPSSLDVAYDVLAEGDIDDVGVTNIDNEGSVLAEVKIFLEGPYSSGNGEMTTSLNSATYIPEESPYSEDARTVSPIPADVTDWVLVQLRETATGAAVVSKSVLLHKSGNLVGDDGVTTQISLEAPENYYYIIIRHHNHLAVMSADVVPLNTSTSSVYDFTTGAPSGAVKYYGSGGAKEIDSVNEIWGMIAGDVNDSGHISTADIIQLNSVTGFGYLKTDLNLSGHISALDRIIVSLATGFSQVP